MKIQKKMGEGGQVRVDGWMETTIKVFAKMQKKIGVGSGCRESGVGVGL